MHERVKSTYFNYYFESSQKQSSQEFCGKQLELVKQKSIYPYEHMNGFETFEVTKSRVK